MSDMAGIAGNAVSAYQQALTTVSNNIANVATDGYSRQDVSLSALPVTPLGSVFLGSGVAVDRITRQYNAFIEANVRNSGSDLASQEPMVNYANRVVDIMGGQTMGLNSALDQFFSSARLLSSDASSTVLRSNYIRDAQGIADRFGQLSAQLDLVQGETQNLLESAVGQINTLTGQLALVNGQLTKQRTEQAQPPDLLDQRDLLLKQLSAFARLNTGFSVNGTVTVSLGSTLSRDVVVNGNNATRIAANYNIGSPEKVALVLDPYGNPSSLSGITSGSLAGLTNFREQVLGSSRNTLDSLARVFVNETNAIQQQGIDAYGQVGQALFKVDPAVNSAGSVRVAFDDPLRVAAAAQFRVITAANNTSTTNASVSYGAAPGPTANAPDGPAMLADALVNNDHPSAARTVNVSSSLPLTGVATIANGLQDVSIFLNDLQPGQQLQVFTRDGRQVLGQSLAGDAAMQGGLLKTDNGFAAGASYSASYLNVSGNAGYKGMNVFYGAQAKVQLQPVYDSKDQISGTKAFPALLQGGRMAASTTGLGANALVLNGVALGALADPAAGTTLQADAVATWINTKTAQTGVTATARNEIRVQPSDFKFGMPLVINGVSVDTASVTHVNGLVNAINGTAGVNVKASSTVDGELILTNVSGSEGKDIAIAATNIAGSSSINALGLSSGTYRGQLSLTQALKDGNGTDVRTPIQVGFGTSGTPSDLAKLGLRGAAYINGAVKEDLLVFVTGAGLASVSASYAGQAVDAKQSLRSQPMKVEFTTATRYKITDITTGTIVAERDFDPLKLDPAISFQGLQLSLSSPARAGDVFTLDGNQGGIGNNDNIRAMAALETRAVVGNKTLTNSYIDQVNEIGNIARQASIAKTALTVVRDQAVKARDEVSGVSLDKEAADLIRYQQAYQAAAKVLQVASQLFDSVLQVH
jgi:flagellar hook-associated protein FlgK